MFHWQCIRWIAVCVCVVIRVVLWQWITAKRRILQALSMNLFFRIHPSESSQTELQSVLVHTCPECPECKLVINGQNYNWIVLKINCTSVCFHKCFPMTVGSKYAHCPHMEKGSTWKYFSYVSSTSLLAHGLRCLQRRTSMMHFDGSKASFVG